jgi:hypothetical protein
VNTSSDLSTAKILAVKAGSFIHPTHLPCWSTCLTWHTCLVGAPALRGILTLLAHLPYTAYLPCVPATSAHVLL